MEILAIILSMLILYVVVYSAVRTAINDSKLVKLLEEKNEKEFTNDRNNFLHNDLDD